MRIASTKLRRLLCAVFAALFLASAAVPALAVPGSSTLAPYATSDYVVIVHGLNVRTGPGMGYAVRTVIKEGERVTYIKMEKGWWQVRLSDGTTGWVDKQYLTPVTADVTGTYVVKASSLNVRKEPKTSAKRVATVKKGTLLRISKLNGDWGYVPAYGGWIALKYVQAANSSSTSTVKAGGTYRVTADHLNVRANPSTSATRRATIGQGTKVKVDQVSGAWAHIAYKSNGVVRYGWVASRYLK